MFHVVDSCDYYYECDDERSKELLLMLLLLKNYFVDLVTRGCYYFLQLEFCELVVGLQLQTE